MSTHLLKPLIVPCVGVQIMLHQGHDWCTGPLERFPILVLPLRFVIPIDHLVPTSHVSPLSLATKNTTAPSKIMIQFLLRVVLHY